MTRLFYYALLYFSNGEYISENAFLTQMVVRLICNQKVIGSSPLESFI